VKSSRILGSMRTCQRAARGSSSLAAARLWSILEDAKGLDVRSTMPSKVHVYEFKTRQERAGRHGARVESLRGDATIR
jgi:hypothetical protein